MSAIPGLNRRDSTEDARATQPFRGRAICKRITVSVVVEVGEVNEAATETVNGLGPPVKPVGKLDHLAIREPFSRTVGSPSPAVDGCVDQTVTVLTVRLCQEKVDPDERVQFLAQD